MKSWEFWIVRARTPITLIRETVDLLTLFSTQASMALQNAHLYSLERRRASQLEAINAIATQTTVVLDIKNLLSKACEKNTESIRGFSRLDLPERR